MTQVFTPKPDGEPQNPVQEAVQKETAAPPVRRFRTILFQGYLIATISVFAMLALLASTTAFFPIDLTITRGLQSIHTPFLDALMTFVSALGYFPAASILTAFFVLVIFLLGYYWEATMTFITVTAVEALNAAVKYIVHRPRPPASLVDIYSTVTNYSFPSGHVMYYVALYGFLLFLVFTLLKRSWRRTLLIILFSLPILLVGASRIYLGAHWASDVLGAYLLGSSGLAVSIVVYRWGKTRFFVRQPVAASSGAEIPATGRQRKLKE